MSQSSKLFLYQASIFFVNTLTLYFKGVTSSGYSCGICKYKAHKSCASNVVVTCKWTTLNTVEKECISHINVNIFTTLCYCTIINSKSVVVSYTAQILPSLISYRE